MVRINCKPIKQIKSFINIFLDIIYFIGVLCHQLSSEAIMLEIFIVIRRGRAYVWEG